MDTQNSSASVKSKYILAVVVLISLITIVSWMAVRFVDSERERDMHEWKSKLDIIVNTRHAAVDSWLESQFSKLSELSQNASLQVYMTELLKSGNDAAGVEETMAEATYLRNLLVVSAERSGFAGRVVGADVDVNVSRIGLSGLALIDMQNRIVSATPTMPPLKGVLADFVKGLEKGQRGLLDMHLGSAGTPTMGFSVPIFAVQGENRISDQVGVVLGIKEVGHELFPLLQRPGAEETEEAVLVRKSANRIKFLSPRSDGSAPLKNDLMADTPGLVAMQAIENPGSFIVGGDYQGEKVLAVSRSFEAAPWSLLYKVNADVALAESEARLNNLAIMLTLIVVGLTLFLTAAWWFGSSRRAEMALDAFQKVNKELTDQRNFLQLLTENLPNPLFIVSKDNRYRFANQAAAKGAGIPVEDIPGKTMDSVMGPHASRRFKMHNKFALKKDKTITDVYEDGSGENKKVLQSVHIPMPTEEDTDQSVLVITEDISGAVQEREQRERILEQIITVLVSLVDRRDPNAVDHSVFVSNVASSMAEILELSTKEADTIRTAAKLMNLGKLLVPKSILLKNGPLTTDEKAQMHESMDQTASLLRGIEFEMPIADIINQVHEAWDGSGRPNGLKGEEILLASRIINAANAFVAMTSSRAYREGMDVGDALDNLSGRADKTMDRRVIAALTLLMEHRVGREGWKTYVEGLGKTKRKRKK